MWVLLLLLLGVSAAVAAVAVRCHGALRELRRTEQLAAGEEFDLTRTELACLTGSLGALTLTEMYEGGRLAAARSGDVTLTTPAAAGTGAGAGGGAGGEFEAVAVRSLGSARAGDIATLRQAVDGSPEAKALRARLVALGLADDKELVERVRRVNRLTSVLIGAVVVAFMAAGGWMRVYPGLRPVPLAVFLLVAFLLPFTAALWINRVSRLPLRTVTGTGARVLKATLPADHDLRTCDAASFARRIASLEAAMQQRLYTCSGDY
ncbi:hypothetical protein ACFVFS_36080 [Kitasatospora sp. NPDC057692]|uniref:hypothetical protein n=1 Tax=Kitasatospora sp. NPDC057692 TaxID=3346215 RepID=UPI003674A96A